MSSRKLSRLAQPSSIALVTPLTRARESKIAALARKAGWQVHLVQIGDLCYSPRPSKYFDSFHAVNNSSEAVKTIKRLNPDLLHLFFGAAETSIHDILSLGNWKTVVDLNDVWSPSLFPTHPERYPLVREILGSADGLCAHDQQPFAAHELDDFPLPSHLTLIPDLGWGDLTPLGIPKSGIPRGSRRRHLDPHKSVHIVSQGMFVPESTGYRDNGMLELANLLAERQIHLHVYPHWIYAPWAQPAGGWLARRRRAKQMIQERFPEYSRLDVGNKFFHFHRPLSPEKLRKVLPEYDAAILVAGSPAVGQTVQLYNSTYLGRGLGSRLADFTDAELPVITNRELTTTWETMDALGVAIDVKDVVCADSVEPLLSRILSLHESGTLQSARERYSLCDKHVVLLDAFYKAVLSEK